MRPSEGFPRIRLKGAEVGLRRDTCGFLDHPRPQARRKPLATSGCRRRRCCACADAEPGPTRHLCGTGLSRVGVPDSRRPSGISGGRKQGPLLLGNKPGLPWSRERPAQISFDSPHFNAALLLTQVALIRILLEMQESRRCGGPGRFTCLMLTAW